MRFISAMLILFVVPNIRSDRPRGHRQNKANTSATVAVAIERGVHRALFGYEGAPGTKTVVGITEAIWRPALVHETSFFAT